MITPTRRTAALLALVALVGVLLPLPPIVPVLAAIVVVGCAAADALVVRSRRPRGQRTRPGTLARASAVEFLVEATVPGARARRLRQPVPPELSLEPRQVTGRGEDPLVLTAQLTGRHRGGHELAPAVVRASGPLDLAQTDTTFDGTLPVTVFPDLPAARRLAELRRRGRAPEEGRARARLGLGTEFETIRDYSPDDDVRQVNWVATSRVGRPMSNQYRVDENRDLVCIVDTGRLMAAPIGDATRLDVALDAVAVLAVAADEAGDRVGTVAFAGDVIRTLTPRRRGAEQVVRALYDLEPSEVEAGYEQAFQAVSGRKRALLALFTDLLDQSAARSLTDALPVLLRRHAVMVASCRDPDLRAAVRSVPTRPFDVYRAAVAVEVIDSQARAVNLMRSMGATVVEAAPESLGAACVNGYLALKQRAVL